MLLSRRKNTLSGSQPGSRVKPRSQLANKSSKTVGRKNNLRGRRREAEAIPYYDYPY